MRRHEAATRLGVSEGLLVAWERGTERVTDDGAAALVDLYGERLTALVPVREPVAVDLGRIAVGSKIKVLASTAHDDVLAAYVELLRAVREAKPGTAVALRTSDLEVLATTIGTEVDDVEARIVELLRCTRTEARTLHDELRRRKLLVPVAGLALGAVAITGVVAAAPGHAPAPTAVHTAPVAHTTTTTTSTPSTPTTVAPEPHDTTAPTPTTPTSAAPPVTTTTMAPLPPPVTAPPTTAAPAVPAATAANAPDVDDPPVGIPEGETPTIVQP